MDQQSAKSVSQLDEPVALFVQVGLCRVNVRAYLHHLFPRKQEQDHPVGYRVIYTMLIYLRNVYHRSLMDYFTSVKGYGELHRTLPGGRKKSERDIVVVYSVITAGLVTSHTSLLSGEPQVVAL